MLVGASTHSTLEDADGGNYLGRWSWEVWVREWRRVSLMEWKSVKCEWDPPLWQLELSPAGPSEKPGGTCFRISYPRAERLGPASILCGLSRHPLPHRHLDCRCLQLSKFFKCQGSPHEDKRRDAGAWAWNLPTGWDPLWCQWTWARGRGHSAVRAQNLHSFL